MKVRAALVLAAGAALLAGCGLAQLGPVRASADAFGTAVAQHQWAAAAAMVCSRDKATVTAQSLADRFSTPVVTGYSSGGGQITDVNGRTTAQAELIFHTASGIDSNVTIPLVQESKVWRPCP